MDNTINNVMYRQRVYGKTPSRVRFSWGPAAVSNAMWTGVWVKDILEHIGIKSFEEGARHVCFVGADKLPNGYYGTSIRREV